ncbi:sulfate adenylyltransferase [Motilibacter peucedani]|uniref:adenylyl-sulfate kinase n=1 Tax=Motilibacter peucedani TaxID=598650 RepID=A0A420XMV2_9ACTN|nr:adenylyl-sulfate kinase [Motilibacter peucedani]RKS72605.1 sulfate adenylyltransferase [Motilibacter peucedani]
MTEHPLRIDDARADDVELALDGLLAADVAELPVPLVAPEGISPGDRVVLVDREAVPFAAVDPVATSAEGRLAGPLVRLRHRSARELDTLRLLVPAAAGTVLVPTGRPLHRHDVAAVQEQAGPAPVVLVALTGAGQPWAPTDLVRALEQLPDVVEGRWQVRTLPLPAHPDLPAEQEAALHRRVCAAAGAASVVLPVAGPLSDDELDELLAAGGALPAGFTYDGVEGALRRSRPPRAERGLVVLFTGLSGSGKSTVARAVVEQLRERSTRTTTLLDGDVVRTMLSSGLGFSRPDRELNVRRIGWVAAEVGRHGGTAVCAPIAPYAAVRDEVRAMARAAGAEYVLVHVATPLEVCEARDRKGLYAKARRGEIPEFTGISDPYEEPADADLRIDTADTPLDECVAQVWALLAARGLVQRSLSPAPATP